MKFFPKKAARLTLSTSLSIVASFALSFESAAFAPSPLSAAWLTAQISKHPDIIAANASMNAVFSSVKGTKLPLYNPELVTGFEREGNGNNYSVGINQTIDLWDKKSVRVKQSDYRLTAASKQYNYTVQQKTAQALKALIVWQSAKAQARLAFAQEKQLDILLSIVTKRQRAGDLGEVDAQLTFLNQSQLLNQSAQIQAKLQRATANVKELLPDWTPESNVYPQQGLGITNLEMSDQLIAQHPLIARASALWNVQKGEAKYAALETKADPTVGFNVGKNARDNVVGITFSMLLNIRNNYSEQVAVQNQLANAAQANFHAVFRSQKFLIKANTDVLRSNQRYLQRWEKLMDGRAQNSAQLLQKQWEIGDFNTADYLTALQQRTQGLYAGIDLRTTYQLSEVEWLLSAGKINEATKLL